MKKILDYHSDLNFVDGQISRDGTLLLLETDMHEVDFFERPVPRHDWMVRMINKEGLTSIKLKHVPLIPTEVDLFTDGTLLIVQGRCQKEGNKIERNARRYNPNGQLIDAFTLGDGIAQVQIDEIDTIWVSYFDEGIFGNFGWDDPMGKDGFVAYSISGEKVWSVTEHSMIDCDAFHLINSNECYFYYYDLDYRLVHIKENKTFNILSVQGQHELSQFTIDKIGIIGTVDNRILKYFQLKGKTFKLKGKIKLVDEKGKQIKGRVFVRGSYIYVYANQCIYYKEL